MKSSQAVDIGIIIVGSNGNDAACLNKVTHSIDRIAYIWGLFILPCNSNWSIPCLFNLFPLHIFGFRTPGHGCSRGYTTSLPSEYFIFSSCGLDKGDYSVPLQFFKCTIRPLPVYWSIPFLWHVKINSLVEGGVWGRGQGELLFTLPWFYHCQWWVGTCCSLSPCLLSRWTSVVCHSVITGILYLCYPRYPLPPEKERRWVAWIIPQRKDIISVCGNLSFNKNRIYLREKYI